ncbi:hypothetical protein GBA52_004386 [Prunus armeniaca]|nr:hypothetical protein GBA52_004386 [Prunus armeniaca]
MTMTANCDICGAPMENATHIMGDNNEETQVPETQIEEDNNPTPTENDSNPTVIENNNT